MSIAAAPRRRYAGAMADAIIEARQGQADVTEEVAEAEAEATEE